VTCFVCKGTVKDGFSNFSADLGKSVVVVKSVPSQVCQQCGDTSYSTDTVRRLEEITDTITKQFHTEVAVVSYTERAA